MSTPPGWIRCPRCGRLNPPDSKFCQYCGAPLVSESTQVAAGLQPAQPTSAAPPPPMGEESQSTRVLAPQSPAAPAAPVPAAQQPGWMQAQASRPVSAAPPECSGQPLPVPYYLVFPDGKQLVRYSQMCVYGREDFEPYIPREYAKFITRRSKGGQFTIYCEVKDVNTIICYIRDDFSRNPTLLNGIPIKGRGAIMLNHGDIISPAGVVNIRFLYATPPPIARQSGPAPPQ